MQDQHATALATLGGALGAVSGVAAPERLQAGTAGPGGTHAALKPGGPPGMDASTRAPRATAVGLLCRCQDGAFRLTHGGASGDQVHTLLPELQCFHQLRDARREHLQRSSRGRSATSRGRCRTGAGEGVRGGGTAKEDWCVAL